MKKTLIALTLAALPVVSMAEVVLYGQIKGGVEVTKMKDVKGTETKIVDYGSRIGFKGQEQLNDSLKAIWQLEQKVNIGGGEAGFGTRNSFIGLESRAGTVKAGYMHNPLGDVNGELDTWEYSNGVAGLGVFTRGNDAVKRRLGVSYETPNMAGFTAKAYVSPSDNNRVDTAGDTNATMGGASDNRRADRPVYGIGISYKQPVPDNSDNKEEGFFADVAGVYVKRGDNNRSAKGKDAYQAFGQVGFRKNNMLFGVAYQHAQDVDNFATLTGIEKAYDGSKMIDTKDYKVKRSQEVAATAAYTINNAMTVKGSASYGFNIKDHDGAKLFGNGKYMQAVVGADYNLSKRTQLNGQVGYLQFGKKEYDAAIGTVGVGLKHKF